MAWGAGRFWVIDLQTVQIAPGKLGYDEIIAAFPFDAWWILVGELGVLRLDVERKRCRRFTLIRTESFRHGGREPC
jgi:hypothetical protein